MPRGIYKRPKLTINQKKRKFSKKHVKLSCGCWVYLGKSPRGRTKFVWKLYNGKKQKELFLLHKCDIQECENPNHLFLGTQSDNINDMYRKGRDNLITPNLKGEENGAHKLVEQEVLEIRSLYQRGYTKSKLARMYGVSHTVISYIISRKLWKHI